MVVIILLTNDDGIFSPGINALYDIFSPQHDVWIFAPNDNRSGCSNGITITDPMSVTQIAEKQFSVNGTPADCVILALLGGIPVVPDVVISGINIGANLGSDIVYSGTCAAARQAVYKHVPGIAVSLHSFTEPYYFDAVSRFMVNNLPTFIGLWDEHHFININVPNIAVPKEGVITLPAMRRYKDYVESSHRFGSKTYYFVKGEPESVEPQQGTDWYAVENGNISISPIMISPVNHTNEQSYRSASFV